VPQFNRGLAELHQHSSLSTEGWLNCTNTLACPRHKDINPDNISNLTRVIDRFYVGIQFNKKKIQNKHVKWIKVGTARYGQGPL